MTCYLSRAVVDWNSPETLRTAIDSHAQIAREVWGFRDDAEAAIAGADRTGSAGGIKVLKMIKVLK